MAAVLPADDVRAAEWLVADIRSFAESVLSLVPTGFAAYVRIFHPARRSSSDGEVQLVRWAEIADAAGARMHAGVQLDAINGNRCGAAVGTLPRELASLVARTLEAHTTSPDRCWFAVWDGYGAARGSAIGEAPRFRLPRRDYHLLYGPIDALEESMLDAPWWQCPNLCWPDDRAWCLASEIDLYSTYLGCDERCRDAILAHPDLEALPIDPATGISFASDAVN